MISFTSGNLFNSNTQTIVNTVNLVGVMGKGIALEFKHLYPPMYRNYRAMCQSGSFEIGMLDLHKYREPYHWVLNFPTKRHWRDLSRLDDIECGLVELAATYRQLGITSIAMPPLGCGNGGLQWDNVYPLIFKHLSDVDIPIVLYAPTI